MEGDFQTGWYYHPTLGLIRTTFTNGKWVYRCYSEKGTKPLSKERPLDQWTWALSEAREDITATE